MKKIILLLLISVSLITIACKKRQIKKINEDLVEGSWKVERFELDGTDLTSTYSSWKFEFTEDGFIDVKDSTHVSGAWKISRQQSTEVPLGSYLECAISLPYPLDDLAGFWNVRSYETDKLELRYSDTLITKKLVFTQN